VKRQMEKSQREYYLKRAGQGDPEELAEGEEGADLEELGEEINRIEALATKPTPESS